MKRRGKFFSVSLPTLYSFMRNLETEMLVHLPGFTVYIIRGKGIKLAGNERV
jgi:hypothetical protein